MYCARVCLAGMLLALFVACGPAPGPASADATPDDGQIADAPAATDTDAVGCATVDPCQIASAQADGPCQTYLLDDGTPCGPPTSMCSAATCVKGVCTPDPGGCKFDKADGCIAAAGNCGIDGACHVSFMPGTPCNFATSGPCATSKGVCGADGTCNALGFLPKGTACESSDACNPGFCTTDGKCEHEKMPIGTVCGPGSICHPATCSAGGSCDKQFAAKGINCAKAGSCSTGECDGAGSCLTAPKPAGTTCSTNTSQDCPPGTATCNDKGWCNCLSYLTGKQCPFYPCVAEPNSGTSCFDAYMVNPCMADPATWSAKGVCMPQILVGKTCPVPSATACQTSGQGICAANAHCAPSFEVGLPCATTQTGPCVLPGKCDTAGKCPSIIASGKSCATADPCRPTGLCSSNGDCEAPIALGAACETDDICRPAGTCDATGKCAAPVAVGKTCGPAVGQCFVQTCQANGQCGKTPTPGEACSNDVNPCKKGMCDLAGACTETVLLGAACPTNNSCTTGACAADGHCATTPVAGAACPGGKCLASGQCAKACTSDAGCWSTCGAGTGKCGADGLCSGTPNAGKPAPTGWDICVASAVCNEFGTTDITGKPDGQPCSKVSTCIKGSVCMAGHCLKGPVDQSVCDNDFPCDEDICCTATEFDGTSFPPTNMAYFGQCLHKGSGNGIKCGGGGCYPDTCYGGSTDWKLTQAGGCTSFMGGDSCVAGCGMKCHAKSPCMLSKFSFYEDGCPCTFAAAPDGTPCGDGFQCFAGECVLKP